MPACKRRRPKKRVSVCKRFPPFVSPRACGKRVLVCKTAARKRVLACKGDLKKGARSSEESGFPPTETCVCVQALAAAYRRQNTQETCACVQEVSSKKRVHVCKDA